jgi:diaminohydroxyphosphoribosylaminopyrimidine deaminase/5-amino-6-(5-phosphoribosylamino)uracil reductase
MPKTLKSHTMKTQHTIFMQKAIELAAKGKGRTSPNPAVGAVIVKGNRIIAQGYHQKSGSSHAEIKALKKAGNNAKGSTLYINLEPCCHTDKITPPCTGAIIKSGVKKVIVAMIDPNPKVSGKGLKELKKAGIRTESGIMNKEAKRLNEAFIKFISKKEPFVILKIAQTIDGKIATAMGESKWITGKKSREYVHRIRNEVDAVLVGINTVRKDDPLLTCRVSGGRNPYRVIVDSSLRIGPGAKVLRHKDGKTIVATTLKANKIKIEYLKKRGAQVIITKDKAGRVDLKSLMKELGNLNIASIMIEGGSFINASALSSKIVDKVLFFIAPGIMGGKDSVTSVGGKSLQKLGRACAIKDLEVKTIGEDLLVEGYVSYK